MDGSLYKHGNVYWVAYRVNGKLCRESTETTKKLEAKDFLDKLKKEIREGKWYKNQQIKDYKFGELAQVYINWTKPQKAFNDKKRRVAQLVSEFGILSLSDFTTIDIENYKSKRLEHNKPATVNRILTIIKHMFRMSTDWEIVKEDVLKRIKKVKLSPENNTRLRFLS